MSYASGEAVAASAGPLAPGPTNIFLISEEDDEDMDDGSHCSSHDDDCCLPVTTVTAPPKSLSRINFEIPAKNSRHAMYSNLNAFEKNFGAKVYACIQRYSKMPRC